ncbi:Oxysterol-binding protein [Poronia punctata]|nr:Oxysterol-binding protein [Poronia punctata]
MVYNKNKWSRRTSIAQLLYTSFIVIYQNKTKTSPSTNRRKSPTRSLIMMTRSHISQLRTMLSFLATIKGDLSNITAPPFILAPISVTEIPASWAAHHEIFLRPAHEEDPGRRVLLVLKNFFCSLNHQVKATTTTTAEAENPDEKKKKKKKAGGVGIIKKPLNGFLGEIFIGSFGGSTRVVVEQVSHHPPVTASALYNLEQGISSSGYVAQETTFTGGGSVCVKQVGHAILRDRVHEESHLRTNLPTMTIRGLLTGRPYVELQGTCYVSSSSGYLSTIVFGDDGDDDDGKGMKKSSFWGSGGPRHYVRAVVRKDGKDVYEITGQWNGLLTVRDVAADGHATVIESFHVDHIPSVRLDVKPIEKQSPWESRRAWEKVTGAIRRGDMGDIVREKGKIEEAQRQMRAVEENNGLEWPRVFFQRSGKGEKSKEFTVLARALPDPLLREPEMDRTAGSWSFVGVEAAEVLIKEGAYHDSLEPTG